MVFPGFSCGTSTATPLDFEGPALLSSSFEGCPLSPPLPYAELELPILSLMYEGPPY